MCQFVANQFSKSLVNDDKILFDFLQPVEQMPSILKSGNPAVRERLDCIDSCILDIPTWHISKYRNIIRSIARNPFDGYIAGGYFTKFLAKRPPQPVTVYVNYDGDHNPPTLDDFYNLIHPHLRTTRIIPMPDILNSLGVYGECTTRIDLKNYGTFDVKIRFTVKKVLDLLSGIDYHPARIAYSYADNCLYFDQWFLIGGPREAGSRMLEKTYEEKGFVSDEFFPSVYTIPS